MINKMQNKGDQSLVGKIDRTDPKKIIKPVLFTLPPFFSNSLTYYANRVLLCNEEAIQYNWVVFREKQKLIEKRIELMAKKLPLEFALFIHVYFNNLYYFLEVLEECQPKRLTIGFPPLPEKVKKETEFLRELTIRIVKNRELKGLQTLISGIASNWLEDVH